MTMHPFGAGTLLIPFETAGDIFAPSRAIPRMSRMRRAGELFRDGVTPLSPVRNAQPVKLAGDAGEGSNFDSQGEEIR
jgi:hypothetical protein